MDWSDEAMDLISCPTTHAAGSEAWEMPSVMTAAGAIKGGPMSDEIIIPSIFEGKRREHVKRQYLRMDAQEKCHVTAEMTIIRNQSFQDMYSD